MNRFSFFFFLIAPLFVVSCGKTQLLGLKSRLGFGCGTYDMIGPDPISNLTEITPPAITRSPEYTWDASDDFCEIIDYEFSIGTTPEGEELLPWTSLGITLQGQATNLLLVTDVDYFTSIRAIDGSGNPGEAATSEAWNKLDPLSSLPDLILRLDPDNLASLLDPGGRTPITPGFTGFIEDWNDTSGSANIHNFFSISGAARPTFNLSERSLNFDGIDDAMSVPDHTDLNTGDVNQRNFTIAFETSNDINSRQIIYDEGGNIRGMNIYIFNNELYCGFYNVVDDGDGSQPFVFVKTPAAINSRYVVTWVFDYSNYAGPAGPLGSLECFVNGNSIGTSTSTSLLYAHSGDIGLGAMVNSTYFETGAEGGNGFFFEGKVLEMMIVNGVPSNDELTIINLYLMDKWSVF